MKRFFLFLLVWSSFSVMAAQRIVSLSPALTELVVHLGGRERLIGRSSACDRPSEIRHLPVMGDFARPHLERIVAAKADLVVTSDLVNPGLAATLKRYGITVRILPCRNAAEYLEAVRFLSDALGTPAAPEIERTRKVLAHFRSLPPLPLKVLVIVWGKPVIAAGRGTYPAEIVKLAGAASAATASGYFKPSQEYLAANPASLIVIPDRKILPQLQRNRALKRSRILVMEEGDLLVRPGPRWAEGVELLRQKLKEASK